MKTTINVIEGASYQEKLTQSGAQVSISGTATRIAIVDGVADGSDNAASSAIVRALAMVAARFPYGTIYDPQKPFCIVRGYRGAGFVEDSSAVRVEIVYETPVPQQPGQGIFWTVEDDGFVQQATTQFDPTGKVLRLGWDATKDPAAGAIGERVLLKNARGKWANSPALTTQRIATVTYPEPVRRIVLSGVVPSSFCKRLRGRVRYVNIDEWSDLPPGHWRFSRFASSGIAGIKYRNVRIELDGMLELDWATFALMNDRHDGEYKCNDDAAEKLRKSPYQFGRDDGDGGKNAGTSGVSKLGYYRETSFFGIFGISDIDEL